MNFDQFDKLMELLRAILAAIEGGDEPLGGSHPKLKDVQAWAATIGCPPAEAERFWNHFEASGWVDKNGNLIVNPRAKLNNWWTDCRGRIGEQAARGPSGAEIILRQKELDRLEKEIASTSTFVQQNRGFPMMAQQVAAERDKLAKYRARRTELMRLLGIQV